MTTEESTESNFKDEQLQCQDCLAAFTWSAGEQEYSQRMMFSQPRRCPECRKRRRAEKPRFRKSADY